MPCVFPIISIKILGFVKKSGSEKKKIFRHGLLFGIGVLVSFWFLAALLIALQSAGYKLGWGFQLQSPVFLIGMIFVLFLIGLNLYGFFEFGGRLQNIEQAKIQAVMQIHFSAVCWQLCLQHPARSSLWERQLLYHWQVQKLLHF